MSMLILVDLVKTHGYKHRVKVHYKDYQTLYKLHHQILQEVNP